MDLQATRHADVSSLPPEIFIAILHQVTRLPAELMSLAIVCRSWRDVVLGTGELWNYILINAYKNEEQLHRQLELSGEALLLINLTYDAPFALLHIVLEWNGPRPIYERVSSLEIHASSFELDDDCVPKSLSEGHTWPQLKKLKLISLHQNLSRVHLRAPHLEFLQFWRVNLHDWNHLGLGSVLYDVIISDTEPGEDVTAFLRAVAHCSNLRQLAWDTIQQNLTAPFMLTDRPLWPKLAEIDLRFEYAALPDVIAILVNTPHLNKLRLTLKGMAESVQTALSHTSFTPGLRELEVIFDAEVDGRGEYWRRLALMQSVVDLFDPAGLVRIHFRNVPVPQCGLPALCSQLQSVQLVSVAIPLDFMESLDRCLLCHCVVISGCRLRATVFPELEEHLRKSCVVFNGRTLGGAGMQLRTLTLYGVVLCPGFMVQLSQHTQLRSIILMVLLESEESDHRLDIEAITPLPHLCELIIDVGPGDIFPAPKPLMTPTARQIVSTAAQLARNASSVFIRLAPLRASDIARCLFHPGRTHSNFEIGFKLGEPEMETLSIGVSNGVDSCLPIDDWHPEQYVLRAEIEWIELSDVADMILSHFPLDRDIDAVSCDETAVRVIQMVSERNPAAVGLQYLLRQANATTDDNVLL